MAGRQRWTAAALAGALSMAGAASAQEQPAGPALKEQRREAAAEALRRKPARNEPPKLALKTTPRENGGKIGGPAPLSVTFNLCQSSDPDRGDQLRFSYDFGDGGVSQGSCRASHSFKPGNYTARVCVSDRQPDHEVCAGLEVSAN